MARLRDSPQGRVQRVLYAVCQVLTRLGYTLGIPKCTFVPAQRLEFVGILVDSVRQAFVLPGRKVTSFAVLRDMILTGGMGKAG